MASDPNMPRPSRERGSDQEGSELWFWLLVMACAGLVAASLTFERHGVGLKSTFAIYAIAGFVAPIVLAAVARIVSGLLVQREDYYDG